MMVLPSYPSRWSGLLLLALTIFIIPIKSGAQPVLENISIEKGAQLWIEGSAGIINYECRAEELSGKGKIENTQNPQSTVKGHGDVYISVALPVKSLNCGKRAMNNDMYAALKSERHPTIRYELLDAELAEERTDTSARWMSIRTKGIMEIAGVEDTTTVYVKGRLLSENRFQVKGQKQILMSTYNIDPPSKMFGLIKTDEELTVHFDVTVNMYDKAR